MCFGCINGSTSAVKEPLHSRVSGDVSLPEDRPKSTITTSSTPYEPPTTSQLQQNVNNTSSSAISVPMTSSNPMNNEKLRQDLSSLPIPEKSSETTLTGWLFYRTGNVLVTYEKAFFVLEDGYLYLYDQPKRSAASEKGPLEFIFTSNDR